MRPPTKYFLQETDINVQIGNQIEILISSFDANSFLSQEFLDECRRFNFAEIRRKTIILANHIKLDFLAS